MVWAREFQAHTIVFILLRILVCANLAAEQPCVSCRTRVQTQHTHVRMFSCCMHGYRLRAQERVYACVSPAQRARAVQDHCCKFTAMCADILNAAAFAVFILNPCVRCAYCESAFECVRVCMCACKRITDMASQIRVSVRASEQVCLCTCTRHA